MSRIDGRELFERDLKSRGVDFAVDPESGGYVVIRGDGTRLIVSVENLARELARDGDPTRVSRFVDTLLASGVVPSSWESAKPNVFLVLEPNDYEEPSELRRPLTELVDVLPVLFNPDVGSITWITPSMLGDWGVSQEEVTSAGQANLNAEARTATLEYKDVDGVRLGYLTSRLPFKASLLLAPDLRITAEPILGWPILAVAPARDFLYLWSAGHPELIGRLGSVVLQEFRSSPYPISTEIYEVGSDGVDAIGEYATDE
jgi:hypothetical protein